MNLFIQQVELPEMELAYTMATNYSSAYERIEKYLVQANKNIIDAVLYHAEIKTMNSKIVFLYTDAIKDFDEYEKNEIQILSVEKGIYLTLKLDREVYQKLLFGNKKLQDTFNNEIENYCKIHNVVQHFPAIPYLALNVDGKEQLFFPVKKAV
ncbi:MAG: hypothetical protein WCY80_02745 [Candidatus Izemoplasmatales bacterium]